MRRIVVSGLSAMLGLFLLASPALAGFVVHKEVKTNDTMSNGSRAESQVEYYDTNAGKFASKNAILNFGTGVLILLNPQQKTYYRNTVDGYCRDMQKMVSAFTSSPQYQKMQKALKQMQKSMKGKYGNQAMPQPPKTTLRKVGVSRVAGYRAEHYQVMSGSQVERDVWLADDPRLDALDIAKNPHLKKKALALEQRFNSCAEKFSQMVPGGPKNVDPLAKETRFQLRNKGPYTDDTTVSIERRRIPASRFEVPAGYRNVTLKQLMKSASQGHATNMAPSVPGGMPSQMKENFPAREMPSAAGSQAAQKNLFQKDASDIGRNAAQNAHNETKKGIENKINSKVKKGVKGLMNFFGN